MGKDPGEVMAEHLGRFSHHTVARRGSSVAVPRQSLVGMQGRAVNSLHVAPNPPLNGQH